MTIALDEYCEAALLRAMGYRLHDARIDADSGRVALIFDDPKGRAEKVIEEHRHGGVGVNSLSFAEALTWAKNRIFEAKGRQRRAVTYDNSVAKR